VQTAHERTRSGISSLPIREEDFFQKLRPVRQHGGAGNRGLHCCAATAGNKWGILAFQKDGTDSTGWWADSWDQQIVLVRGRLTRGTSRLYS
jgi:hypothetical protein